ncbi:Fis family transcriptional regulator [Pseudomonas anguilliseptica]|uniref:Fis family transcriptional regulator n=1 Tax=Pseudomonas anguilliseptica TaxID=53406 RepID=UPI0011150337|nr:Fis family transcriptional regulator [Pseudomonas anguilliseptica]
MDNLALRKSVSEIVGRYLADLDGEVPSKGLYKVFINDMDYAVYRFVFIRHSKHQSNATKTLGISRATFRKRLIELDLHEVGA